MEQIKNATKFYLNTRVVFKADNPIDNSHIDIIIMFLENAKLSGGGNISKYDIDPFMRILTVEFEKKQHKHQILTKKVFNILTYTLTAEEPTEDQTHETEIDDCVLILKNVPELDDFVVKSYAESLVSREEETPNEAKFYLRSYYFRNIYYVRFEREIDFEYCQKRLERRPTLNEKKIEIQQGFVTCTLFFKADPTKLNEETVIEYFNNKKKFDVSPLQSIKSVHPFYLLKFHTLKNLNEFLLDNQRSSFRQRLSNANIWQNVFFENVFDMKLLNDEIRKLNKKWVTDMYEMQNKKVHETRSDTSSRYEENQLHSPDSHNRISSISNHTTYDDDFREVNEDVDANKIKKNLYRIKNLIKF